MAGPPKPTTTGSQSPTATGPPKPTTAGPPKPTTADSQKLTATGPPKPTTAGPAVPVGPPETFQQTQAVPLQDAGVSQVVEVDSEFYSTGHSDQDSLYSSSFGSETTSLTPSVFDYTYENGRRYASDRFKASYFLPNDDHEQDRLDLYHHIFSLIGGGRLYIAPIGRPHRVLDVGTGTGIWAIDFAHDHPESEVIGVDISPIQPAMVPPNCTFEVDDVEEPWTWKKNHFDYIHLRSLSGSIQNWKKLFQQSFDHLAPGGIVEFQDYGCECFFHDGRRATGVDAPLVKYCDMIVEAAEKLGRPLPIGRNAKQMMESAGFVDVHEQTGIWPLGPWPKDKSLKELGRWTKQGCLETLEPFALQLLKNAYGMSVDKISKFCDEVKKDIDKTSQNKYYFQGWFVWGRKPESHA